MADRLAALTCQVETETQTGSGVLIKPGLILTALHVVLGADPPDQTPDGATARVRLTSELYLRSRSTDIGWDEEGVADRLTDASDLAPWRDAVMIWPPAGAPTRLHDCALLQAPDAVGASDTVVAVTPARLTRHTDCIGFGYPDFTARELEDGRALREIHTFFGAANMARAPKLYSSAIDITISNETPESARHWRGLSGAGVWINDGVNAQLLGVMHEQAPEVFARNHLTFWPLSAIGDEAFWTACGWTAPVAETPVSQPIRADEVAPDDVKDHFLDFDRGITMGKFRNWLKGDRRGRAPIYHRRGPPEKPAVVVLRGHKVDEVSLCAERLAKSLALGPYKNFAAIYETPVVLHCESAEIDAYTRADNILDTWARRVGPRNPEFDDDFIDLIAEGIAAPDRPRAAILEHDDVAFSDGCATTINEALIALAAAGEALAAGEPPPVLILCLITGEGEGRPDSAFLPAQPFPEKERAFDAALAKLCDEHPDLEWLIDLSPLGDDPCRKSHFDDWISELAEEHGLMLSQTSQATIQQTIEKFDKFPMRFARHVMDVAFSAKGD